jgi:hypothetical protein
MVGDKAKWLMTTWDAIYNNGVPYDAVFRSVTRSSYSANPCTYLCGQDTSLLRASKFALVDQARWWFRLNTNEPAIMMYVLFAATYLSY